MAKSVLVDAGFLVALLNRRDAFHHWAVAQAAEHTPPWHSCESVLSEAFHLLESAGAPSLSELLSREALLSDFDLTENLEPTLKLMQKYSNIPMSLADACLVRMTEILPDPVLLTTDADFRVYRRSGRQIVPSLMPR